MSVTRWFPLGVLVWLMTTGASAGSQPEDLAPLLPKRVDKSAFAAVAVTSARPGPFTLELTAVEEAGGAGWRPVTIGVPLLPGQAKETAELRLAVKDAAGKLTAVPAQFRVLARWWRQDDSIRWVLVDASVSVQPRQKVELVLTNQALPAAAPASPVKIEQNDWAITIDTGGARFVINRKKFNLLDHVFLDGGKEDLLAGSADGGSVIEDTHGIKYLGSAGTRSVEVIEAGPMRACVRARGQHVNPDSKAYPPGMYGYDVFLNFYAGQSAVHVDHIITNNPPKSAGSPTFEDASVMLKLRDESGGFEFVAEKPVQGKLAGAESACLYQDSNGADTWAACPGFGHMNTSGWGYPQGTVTSFRGYQLLKRSGAAARAATQPDGAGEAIGQGDRARGLAAVGGPAGGVIIYVPNFWQLFPKAIEVGPNGRVRLGLLPRETKVPHFLEDASATGTQFVLAFTAGQPTAGAVADTWANRLMPRPPLEHIAACGALADTGPYSTPTIGLDKTPDSKNAANHSRMFDTDKLYGNAYGWQIFGDRWRSNGGHSRRGARQPISEDDYLYRWYVGGLPAWLAIGDARSRHFRDVRIYRIDGQDPFGFSSWTSFRAANRSEDYCNRAQPKDDEYRRFTEGIWSRSDWLLPNPAHMVLDLCYDRYLLFGDQRAFENMRLIAAHGGHYVRDRKPFVHRESGWCWRTLFRYWELTGDADAEACLKNTIKNYQVLVGAKPLLAQHDVNKNEVQWWFTTIFSRAIAMTALHTADPQVVDLCRTMADSVQAGQSKNLATLFAVLYHLTGDEQYKTKLLDSAKAEDMLRAGGYFPACDHWLLHQPPRKK